MQPLILLAICVTAPLAVWAQVTNVPLASHFEQSTLASEVNPSTIGVEAQTSQAAVGAQRPFGQRIQNLQQSGIMTSKSPLLPEQGLRGGMMGGVAGRRAGMMEESSTVEPGVTPLAEIQTSKRFKRQVDDLERVDVLQKCADFFEKKAERSDLKELSLTTVSSVSAVTQASIGLTTKMMRWDRESIEKCLNFLIKKANLSNEEVGESVSTPHAIEVSTISSLRVKRAAIPENIAKSDELHKCFELFKDWIVAKNSGKPLEIKEEDKKPIAKCVLVLKWYKENKDKMTTKI